MRIAIVGESYLPYVSGVTVATETLARGLGARGHEVLLVAPRPAPGGRPGTAGAPGPEPAYAWLPSYELRRVAPSGYRMPVPLPSSALRRAIAFRPEIVHAQSPFVAGRLARRIARAVGAPLVFTHHTRFGAYRHYLGPAARPAAGLLERYLGRFWAACDAVVAPASDLAADIRGALPLSARTLVRVIPTGIDVAGIRATAPIDPRSLAGWPPRSVVAVILGRLAREKRVDVVIEAVALAVERAPELRLAIIGDGPARRDLTELAARRLPAHAWFAGSRPRGEAMALVRGSDLFAFASQTETQGLVLAEALACGLPVAALDGPGVRDSVRDGVDGIVVAQPVPDPVVALSTALISLSLDATRREELARNATDGADRFGIERRMAEMEELYRELR